MKEILNLTKAKEMIPSTFDWLEGKDIVAIESFLESIFKEIVADMPVEMYDTGEGDTCICCNEIKNDGVCEACENWNDHVKELKTHLTNLLT